MTAPPVTHFSPRMICRRAIGSFFRADFLWVFLMIDYLFGDFCSQIESTRHKFFSRAWLWSVASLIRSKPLRSCRLSMPAFACRTTPRSAHCLLRISPVRHWQSFLPRERSPVSSLHPVCDNQ